MPSWMSPLIAIEMEGLIMIMRGTDGSHTIAISQGKFSSVNVKLDWDICCQLFLTDLLLKSLSKIECEENVEAFEREEDGLCGRFSEQEYVGINGLSAEEFCEG